MSTASKAPPSPPAASSTTVKVPHDKIAMRAYEKWCKAGKPHGRHMQDWLEAERELAAEYTKAATTARR